MKIGLDHFAQSAPDTLALVDPRGKHWTRGELFALSNRMARALRVAGLETGDVVAVVSPNCAEYLVTYLAATRIGLYVVPLNWHLAQAEVRYILEDSGAKALVANERLGALFLAGLGEIAPPVRVSIGNAAGFVGMEDFIADHSESPLERFVMGRAILYTSATTGRPKAIELPLSESRSALEKTVELHMAVGIGLEQHVHLCASMLYHAAPLEGAVVALHMGHTVVLPDTWDPELLLGLVERYRVTTAFMPPTMFVRLLKLDEGVRRKYSTACLQRVVHSGAPCPPEIKRRMIDWWGPVLWDTYGAAEGAGTIVSSEEWLKYPGTVGKPIPGSRLKIVNDEDGSELPRGHVGSIYLTRYTGDRFAYKGDPDKTRACHRGEFFTVGDIGYVNEDGYLFICDRKIDMIISGGSKIYSAEVERVLILHPDVADCAIFGVPDEILGEAVRAVVQPIPGVEGNARLTLELLKFLGERLSATKLPKRIEYASTLPRDPTGKLYKRRLREPHWEGRLRAV